MRLPTLLTLSTVSLVLAACGNSGIDDQNSNPFTAARYGDELADSMATIIIQNDPITKDAAIKKIITEQIELGKKTGDDARALQSRGLQGKLVEVKTETEGFVLYVNDMLYLSTEFLTKPGADLHAYMTVAVDPRDVTFPDKTAMDLGALQTVYGAQQFTVPRQDNPELYRTFVLYDKKLKRISGFAQLSKSL